MVVVRGLFKSLCIVCVMLSCTTSAWANDLMIASFSPTITKIEPGLRGSTITTEPQIGYITATESIELNISLAVSWDCVPRTIGLPVCTESATRPDSIVEISIGHQVGGITSWLVVDSRTMLANEVQLRNRSIIPVLYNPPVKQYTFQLSTAAFNQWVAQKYNSHGGTGNFKIRVKIDANNTVIESNELNNSNEIITSDFIPLSGNMNFGASTTTIGEASSLSVKPLLVEKLLSCGGSSGSTGLLTNLELTAKVYWNPSPSTAGWSLSAPGTLLALPADSTLCTQFTLNAGGNAFDLNAVDSPGATVACSNPVFKTAYGNLGGFDVSIDADLCPDGTHPKPFTIDLPDGITAHLPFFGKPIPRGYSVLTFFPASPAPDFNNLAPSLGVGFLVSERVPFAFNLNGGAGLTLSSAGLQGEYGSVIYAYDRNFDPADSRRLDRQGVQSNDSRYSMPSAGAGALSITSTGLQVPVVNFAAYAGNTHFPKMSASWNAASVSIVDSKLAAGQVLAGGAYTLNMSPDCPECSSGSAATAYSLAVTGETVATDGAVAASVVSPADPVWGPWDSTAIIPRNIFSRPGDAGLSGMLYVPGNVIQGTGAGALNSVADFLMGMREVAAASAEPLASHALQNNTSRKGNFYAAGFNLGPELYAGATGAPLVGATGTALTGTITSIGFGGLSAPSYNDVIANIGTKYVIREAGITGVFNTDVAPQPIVYGFQLALSRFAFRTINNAVDDYTWMDGSLDVPGHTAAVQGKGGFTVVFNALSLECSGDVADGTVLSNAGQTFDAWKTSIELQTAGFIPENPSLGVCEPQNRQLQVGNSVDLKALQEPLNILSLWGPDGNPVAGSTEVSGSTDHTLDQPVASGAEAMGFAFAMDRGISMATPTGSVFSGWFGINGELGVPLWKSLKVGTRLANSSTTTQDQSIVMNQTTISGVPYAVLTNADLIADMESITPAIPVTADYDWGTSLNFSFPVYYKAGRVAAGKRPEFLGITQSKDLLVITMNAGADLITPQETKLSFGASADFERLKLSVLSDLNVDLNDPESVAKIDAAFGTTAVSMLVDTIKTPVNVMNNEVGTALDDVLEITLRQSLNGLVNVISPVTNSLGAVQAIPERFASDIADALSTLAANITTPLSSASGLVAGDASGRTFDQKMTDFYLLAPIVLVNAQTTVPAAGVLDPYLAALDAADIRLNDVLNALLAAQAETITISDKVNALVTEMLGDPTAGQVGQIQIAIDDINSLKSALQNTNSFGVTACNPAVNELIIESAQIKTDIESVKGALELVDIIGFASQMSSLVGIDASNYRSAQTTVDNLVSDISGRITDNLGALMIDLGCSGSIIYTAALDSLVSPTNVPIGLLQQILDSLDQLKNNTNVALDSLVDVQLALLNPNTGLIADVSVKLDTAYGQVESVKNYLAELRKKFEDAATSYPNGFEYAGLTAAEIRAEWDSNLLDLTGQSYHWYYTGYKSFVLEMSNSLRQPIDTAIVTAISTANTAVGSLVSLMPHPGTQELIDIIADEVMNSVAAVNVRDSVNLYTAELVVDLNSIVLDIFDQANSVIKDIAMQLQDKANEALELASASVPGIPLKAATLDGYGVATGNELDRLHIGAEWTMEGDSDDNTTSYNAALDITSWNANNKDTGCTTGTGTGNIDAVISTTDLSIKIAGSETIIDELYLGFTLNGGTPQGLFGGISIDGDLDFEAFKILDPSFAAGVGLNSAPSPENYIGASAGAKFSSMALQVAFLVGKTCNNDVLTSLDAQAAEFLDLTSGFNGAYARGGASIPVLDIGCLLTVGVSADVGAWTLVSPFEIGGIVGGGGYGKVACIGALRGQVAAYGSVSGSGKMKFKGEGFGVAGIGFKCEPETWTTVSRSRDDKGCGTGDVSFSVIYDDGWLVEGASPTGPH